MESNFIKLETGTILQDKPHCVFVSILCERTRPFLKYIYAKKYREKHLVIPMTMMQMRWDGTIGFPGGKVDLEDYIDGKVTEECLKNALLREMREEINVKESWIDKDNFERLCTFTDGEFYIHNFTYRVNYRTFKKIFRRSISSEHIFSENCGSIVCHLYNYTEEKGINNILKHNFCATAGLELKELLRHLNISFKED